MAKLINKRLVKKQWKKFLKQEDFSDYTSFYKSIQNTAQSMIFQMSDFLFIESIYNIFVELLELNNNIDIMLATQSYETEQLCKERVDFLLTRKASEWYL